MGREKAGEKTVSDDFAQRRTSARARLDALDPHKTPGGVEADPLRRDWFEAVYALAERDPAGVPWANLAPHPLLTDWLGAQGPLRGLRAIDVGCGLGDNALALAKAGAQVTGFDLVAGAIDWARERSPGDAIEFRAADLFAPPPEWRGAFDLVHECYTLQALPESLLPQAALALAGFVAPHGRLLVIARARSEGQEVAGPPWPLTRGQVEALAVDGLTLTSLEDLTFEQGARHWRAVFSRDA
jgi:SAM-dependent methyltransferase